VTPINLADTPAGAIARLDAALARRGENVVLRRVVGLAPNSTNVDVTVRATVRAAVRSNRPGELIGDMADTDSKVTLSPSDIAAAQWPAGEVVSVTAPEPSLPRRGDKVIIAGRVRNVEAVNAVRVADTLVRIELRVLGA
jgi:hypothetical protein